MGYKVVDTSGVQELPTVYETEEAARKHARFLNESEDED